MFLTDALARRLAVAALFLCALAAAGIAVLTATANASPEPAAPVATVQPVAAAEVDPFLAALAPGTDFAPEQAEELLLTADRVCEGFTAEVPVMDLVDSLVLNLGFTEEDARAFVRVASAVHCTSPAV